MPNLPRQSNVRFGAVYKVRLTPEERKAFDQRLKALHIRHKLLEKINFDKELQTNFITDGTYAAHGLVPPPGLKDKDVYYVYTGLLDRYGSITSNIGSKIARLYLKFLVKPWAKRLDTWDISKAIKPRSQDPDVAERENKRHKAFLFNAGLMTEVALTTVCLMPIKIGAALLHLPLLLMFLPTEIKTLIASQKMPINGTAMLQNPNDFDFHRGQSNIPTSRVRPFVMPQVAPGTASA